MILIAERRMFAKSITSSARFLKMPISTQALYFHLGCNADDDGVVEAYSIIRMCGVAEDDLKMLVAKGFLIILNEDQVAFITDWTIHNKIRPDRKTDSVYKELLLKTLPNVHLIESRERADRKTCVEETMGRPRDDQRTTKGPHRLGKDSIGKVSIGKFNPPTLEEVKDYCTKRNNNVNPQYFYDYFNESNWIDAKGDKVRNWKQKVISWEGRSKTNQVLDRKVSGDDHLWDSMERY